MKRPISKVLAEQMAELTLSLLEACQLKQELIAAHHGLSVAEFKVFRKFKENSVLSAGELAARMQLSSSRVTRILDGMVEKAVVTREHARDDRRVVEIALTQHGKEIMVELNSDYVRAHEDILGLLPLEECESVVHALAKLDHAMAKWVGARPGEINREMVED